MSNKKYLDDSVLRPLRDYIDGQDKVIYGALDSKKADKATVETLTTTVNSLPTSFKTINGETITGSGNITVSGSGSDSADELCTVDSVYDVAVGHEIAADEAITEMYYSFSSPAFNSRLTELKYAYKEYILANISSITVGQKYTKEADREAFDFLMTLGGQKAFAPFDDVWNVYLSEGVVDYITYDIASDGTENAATLTRAFAGFDIDFEFMCMLNNQYVEEADAEALKIILPIMYRDKWVILTPMLLVEFDENITLESISEFLETDSRVGLLPNESASEYTRRIMGYLDLSDEVWALIDETLPEGTPVIESLFGDDLVLGNALPGTAYLSFNQEFTITRNALGLVDDNGDTRGDPIPFKTINGESILGEGNITISLGDSSSSSSSSDNTSTSGKYTHVFRLNPGTSATYPYLFSIVTDSSESMLSTDGNKILPGSAIIYGCYIGNFEWPKMTTTGSSMNPYDRAYCRVPAHFITQTYDTSSSSYEIRGVYLDTIGVNDSYGANFLRREYINHYGIYGELIYHYDTGNLVSDD